MLNSTSPSTISVKSFATKGLDESKQPSRIQAMKELLRGIQAYTEAADLYINTALELMDYPAKDDEMISKVKAEIDLLNQKLETPVGKEFTIMLGLWRRDRGLIRRLKSQVPIVNYLLDTAESFIEMAQELEVPNT